MLRDAGATRGPPAGLGAADPPPLPLRHRHVHHARRWSPTSAPIEEIAEGARCRLPRLPLARRRLRGDRHPGRGPLRRLLLGRYPLGERRRERQVRARGARGRRRPALTAASAADRGTRPSGRVLASGSGTNLQAILDRLHGTRRDRGRRRRLGQAGAMALERARGTGSPTRVFPRLTPTGRARRGDGDWLADRGRTWSSSPATCSCSVAGFLHRFPARMINVHPALLPVLPGARRDRAGARPRRAGHRGDGPLRRRGRRHRADHHAAVDRGTYLGGCTGGARGGDPPIEHELLPRAIRMIAEGGVRIDRAIRVWS